MSQGSRNEPPGEKLFRDVVRLLGLCAAIAVVVSNAIFLFSPPTSNGIQSNFQSVLSEELLGIMFVCMSIHMYIRVQKGDVPKLSPFAASYGLATFLFVVGIFSFAVAMLLAYKKIGG